MKNLVIAFAVAMGLCACAAPQAAAQTPSLDMTLAASAYGNASATAQDAFNLATPGSSNWTTAGIAHDAFLIAQDDANTSADYYAIGDFLNGNYYAQLALSDSAVGEKAIADALANNKGSQAVLNTLSTARTQAKHGDSHVADAGG